MHGLQRGMPGAAVLGHVGEQLGRAEVGDGLDRGRRALGQVDDQLDGHVAARGQGGERGAEAVVQHRRVDAAGQVAQLGDGLLGAAVGRVDQLQSPLQVGLGDPGGNGSLVPPSFSRARPSFMATATIWACAPSCRSRSIRRSRAAESSTALGPGLLQLTHPVRQRRAEQPGDQLRVRGVASPQPTTGNTDSAAAPTGTRAKVTARECTDRATSNGFGLPPLQPPRHGDHHAVDVQDLPPDREGQIGEPVHQHVAPR